MDISEPQSMENDTGTNAQGVGRPKGQALGVGDRVELIVNCGGGTTKT